MWVAKAARIQVVVASMRMECVEPGGHSNAQGRYNYCTALPALQSSVVK